MTAACVDCNFSFTTNPDGSRVLNPAFEFIRRTRTVDLPSALFDLPPLWLLTWPTVAEDVHLIGDGCSPAIEIASPSAFRVLEEGWFHFSVCLWGESNTNCNAPIDGRWMAGVLIELNRGGDLFTMGAQISERDTCQAYTYQCAAERLLQPGDTVRSYYYMQPYGEGNVGSEFVLPGSSRNHFSGRLLRRA